MLKNEFYKIISRKSSEQETIVTVELNAAHFIYQAHFPGNPITPGVCILQMIKEITEILCNKNLVMSQAKNIKFVQIINPLAQPEVNFRITYKISDDEQFVDVNAQAESNSAVFVKSAIRYKIQA